ncbi:MAG: hypothetical protein ACUVR7_08065 [Armatimonadota bacterium]
MSRRFWLLLLLAPLLVGCGAGLKEEGRVPVMDPLGLSEGSTLSLTVGGSRSRQEETKQASVSYTDGFSNTSTEINIGNVQRFIINQRIQSSARVVVPGGATLPDTITLRNFFLRATFSDNQGTVNFDASALGTVTLTRTTGDNYAVAIQGSGEEQSLVIRLESGNLSTLAQIVTQGGDNTVSFTLTADVTSDPGLPDGSQIIFTTGLGTGTLEL